MNDVVVNKIQSIQRCVRRAREELAAGSKEFDTNFTRQDAAVLNVLRACEQSIDLANHVIKTHKLGIPTSSGESFDLLAAAKGKEVYLSLPRPTSNQSAENHPRRKATASRPPWLWHRRYNRQN